MKWILRRPGLKTGVNNDFFLDRNRVRIWRNVCDTPPRIPRSNPPTPWTHTLNIWIKLFKLKLNQSVYLKRSPSRSMKNEPSSSKFSSNRPENMDANIESGSFVRVNREVLKWTPPTFSFTVFLVLFSKDVIFCCIKKLIIWYLLNYLILVTLAFFTLEMDNPLWVHSINFKSVFQNNIYMQKLCCKFLVLWFLGTLKITCTDIAILHFITIFSYREEKQLYMSCWHGSKSYGWQQTENITKKVNSDCFKLHRSYSISFCVKCWWNFLGLNPRKPYLSLEK